MILLQIIQVKVAKLGTNILMSLKKGIPSFLECY